MQDQGEKQIKAIEKSNVFIRNMIIILKKIAQSPKTNKIFNKLVDERRDEIIRLGKKIDYGNLAFHYKDKSIHGKSFNNFIKTINLYEKIKKGDIMLKKAKENRNEFKLNLAKVRKVKKIR